MSPSDATLAATPIIDYHHPLVVDFIARHRGEGDLKAQVVNLYYAVRDEIRYDPYTIDMRTEGLAASHVIATGLGWCVTKAVLLTACVRAIGVPSRLGFADVRNHLSTERMRRLMQTDEFIFHGYSAIWLNGQWLKATPAFNLSLCEKFRIKPLEFDGTADSIYHSFDLDGRQHMEYLRYRGEFDDVPVAEMTATFDRVYAPMMKALQTGNFEVEVAAETGSASPAHA